MFSTDEIECSLGYDCGSCILYSSDDDTVMIEVSEGLNFTGLVIDVQRFSD